jgi:hypothetical protein
MEDKTLPPVGLSGVPPTSDGSGRRAFLRRAVAVGVPVVLATVKSRSVLASGANQAISSCGSVNPSCATGGTQLDSVNEPIGTAPAQDTTIDLTPPDPGKLHGKDHKDSSIDLTPPDPGNGKGSSKK